MDFANDLPGSIEEAAGNLPANLLTWIVIAVVALAVLYVLRKALRRKRPKIEPLDLEHPIDVNSLPQVGPPAGGPALDFFNVPVRLAGVVLAPAGVARQLPSQDQFGELFEAVVPGLARVVASHRPVIRQWPSQISTAGFPPKFFAKVKLPGDGGKATPWSSAAGVFDYQDQPYLIGLAMCAGSKNNHGQYPVDRAAKWLDVLRIKNA